MKQHAPFLFVFVLASMVSCQAASPPELPPFPSSEGADEGESEEMQETDATITNNGEYYI